MDFYNRVMLDFALLSPDASSLVAKWTDMYSEKFQASFGVQTVSRVRAHVPASKALELLRELREEDKVYL